MEEKDLQTSVENQEVAAPEGVQTGVEESGVAEPNNIPSEPERNYEADAAFADMRRRMQQAEQEKAMLEEESRRKDEALSMIFQSSDPIAEAIALTQGVSFEEAKAQLAERDRIAKIEAENKALKSESLRIQAEAAMQRDLLTVQAIDPEVKSLKDLGETFLNLISAGLSAEDAYYASKSKKEREHRTAPEEVGNVNTAPKEKDFFTKQEVENMSQEQVHKNYEIIRKSMAKW